MSTVSAKRMSHFLVLPLLILTMALQVIANANANAKGVIEDGGLKIDQDELTWALKYWPEQQREQAADSVGVRFQLLNLFIHNRKIAAKMEQLTPEIDDELYWKTEFAVRALRNKMYIKFYNKRLTVPNVDALAYEQYLVNKKTLAARPEERKVSHILLKSGCLNKTETCSFAERKNEAEALLEKIKKGASFEKMVEKYSQDPASVAKKGLFDRWLTPGEPYVDRYFMQGVFSIKETGGYSDVIAGKEGLHIIRLEDIKETSYRSADEVIPKVITSIEKQYRKLAIHTHMKTFDFSDKAFVDGKLVSEIFKPYQSKPKQQENEDSQKTEQAEKQPNVRKLEIIQTNPTR